MNYKSLISIIIFLIIYSIHFYGQNPVDYSNVSINVNVDINSGELEINPLDIQNLKVLIYGSVDIYIYGTYDSVHSELPTEKRITLSVSPNFIYTTLEPIIIPPTPPPTARSKSIKVDEGKVLLGRFNLGLTNPNYIVTSGEHIFSLNISEKFSRITSDRQEIPIDIFDPRYVPDLIVVHAEILNNNEIKDGVEIKGYIRNIGGSIINKFKVKIYSKVNNKFKLLGTKTLEPLGQNEPKPITFFVSTNEYQNIVNDYIYIIADSEDDIFELNNNNNTLEYYVPEIQSSNANIKVYPNPFEDIINFSFYLNNTTTTLLEIFDRNGFLVYSKEDIFQTDVDIKTISYINDNTLPSGNYFYSLSIHKSKGDTKYCGTIIKK